MPADARRSRRDGRGVARLRLRDGGLRGRDVVERGLVLRCACACAARCASSCCAASRRCARARRSARGRRSRAPARRARPGTCDCATRSCACAWPIAGARGVGLLLRRLRLACAFWIALCAAATPPAPWVVCARLRARSARRSAARHAPARAARPGRPAPAAASRARRCRRAGSRTWPLWTVWFVSTRIWRDPLWILLVTVTVSASTRASSVVWCVVAYARKRMPQISAAMSTTATMTRTRTGGRRRGRRALLSRRRRPAAAARRGRRSTGGAAVLRCGFPRLGCDSVQEDVDDRVERRPVGTGLSHSLRPTTYENNMPMK